MTFYQQPLSWSEEVGNPLASFNYPSTRYQGSKRKLIDWIWANSRSLQFHSVLDVFGGTGVVSYLFKRAGKQVTYNDALRFNWTIGRALIANKATTLSPQDVSMLLSRKDIAYPDLIQNNFSGIYFTDEENRWLDQTVTNIEQLLDDPFKQAIAWFALFQSCIIKRPYNLFHRANLYMRTAEVERGFGNKTTWDTDFAVHFRAFAAEANQAVFDNGENNVALNMDALAAPTGFDLVYIDPPYLNEKGVGVDYRDFYHFLEGMTDYRSWEGLIDLKSRHRRLKPVSSVWNKSGTILDAFDALVSRYRDSSLIVSYRDNGIPTPEQLRDVLRTYKRDVREASQSQKYVLSKTASKEILLIAT